MKRTLFAAFAAGGLFGVGLALSGMTEPTRVHGFLDVAGQCDPTQAFVLAGAVATTATAFRFVLRRERPVFAERFQLSTVRSIDRRLLLGAGLFGLGWGIAGYCPGPALVGLGAGYAEALWFVPAMIAGMALHRWLQSRVERQRLADDAV
jgi:uncharacterized membrane protein YedE/YeeE